MSDVDKSQSRDGGSRQDSSISMIDSSADTITGGYGTGTDDTKGLDNAAGKVGGNTGSLDAESGSRGDAATTLVDDTAYGVGSPGDNVPVSSGDGALENGMSRQEVKNLNVNRMGADGTPLPVNDSSTDNTSG